MLLQVGIAVSVFQSMLMVVYAVVALRTAFKVKWPTIGRKLIGMWRTILKRADLSVTDKAIRQKMQETSLSNFRKICWFTALMLFPAFCITSAGVAQSFVPMDDGSHCVRLVAFACGFFICLWPGVLTVKTLPAWHCVVFLLACLQIVPGVCPQSSLLHWSRISSIFITLINCTLLHNPTSLVQHSVYFLVVVASFASAPLHNEDWRGHARMELSWVVFSCAGVALMRGLAEAQHRCSLETTSLLEKHLANSKLLRMFYDVVLEVDSELTIQSSDPELGLLLPHSAGNSIPELVGTDLGRLFPDGQDRQLLWERTHRPLIGEEANVGVMHVRMSHGGNESLSVELFHLCFQISTGQCRHLLGIREFGDEGQAGPGAREPCMELQIDTQDPDHLIQEISPDLQNELGYAPLGSSLIGFLDDTDEFAQRFQVAVNVLASEDPTSNATFKTVLRPAGRRMRLQASCCLSVDRQPTRCMARLSFSSMVPVRQPRNGGASVGRASSNGSGSSGSRSSGRRGTPRQLRRQALGSSPQVTQLGAVLGL